MNVTNVTVFEPAKEMEVGKTVLVNGLFGLCLATVVSVDGDMATANANGCLILMDKQRDGSWVCQHMIDKSVAGKSPYCDVEEIKPAGP